MNLRSCGAQTYITGWTLEEMQFFFALKICYGKLKRLEMAFSHHTVGNSLVYLLNVRNFPTACSLHPLILFRLIVDGVNLTPRKFSKHLELFLHEQYNKAIRIAQNVAA
jgi:hypothetical protein